MKKECIPERRLAIPVIGCMMFVLLPAAVVAADTNDHADRGSASQIQRGFEISPIPEANLDFARKDRKSVGMGSYLVNAGGCNDCHTHRAYAPGGNPFLGQPEQVNVSQYMAGGRTFPPSPFIAPNLTPDAQGRPAGLTYEQFRDTLRTGHNPFDPPGYLLQVMPWPAFAKKTDGDLRAIYDYLSAIPSLPDNPNPGPEP